jgi:predicted amidophosphoribosyltransferase
VKQLYQTWDIDLVIPVPSSNSRLLERGLSHTGIIAFHAARALELPTSFNRLIYSGTGIPQVGLTNKERSDNVKSGFKAKGGDIKDLSILLIDDVVTTGATIQAAKEALYQGGAKTVFVATLACVTDKNMTNDQTLQPVITFENGRP